MSGNNNNNRRVSAAETAATLAIGAGVAFGAYKLFQSVFGSAESQPHLQSNIGRDGTEEENFFNRDISVVSSIEQLHEALQTLRRFVLICIFCKLCHYIENSEFI